MDKAIQSGMWIYKDYIIGSRWDRHIFVSSLNIQPRDKIIVDKKLYYLQTYEGGFRAWAKENISISSECITNRYKKCFFEVFSSDGLTTGNNLIQNGWIPVGKILQKEYKSTWYFLLMSWGLPLDVAVKIISPLLRRFRI